MLSSRDPRRLFLLVVPVVLCAAVGAVVEAPVGDWGIAHRAGSYLLSDGLDVYAAHPQAQMGPLALLAAAALSWPAYLLLVSGLLLVFLLCVVPPRAATRWTIVTGGVLLAVPWAAFAVQGHADDAMVMAGAAMIVGARERRLGWAMVVGFGLAIAAKPTALLFLPLLFGSRRHLLIGAGVGAVVWLPFVIADPRGFLSAGSGYSDVLPGSAIALFGVEPMSGFPDWVRPVQLLAGLMVCCWAVSRGSWASAIAGVVTIRVLLEPAAWNYYGTSVAAAGLLVDARLGWSVPAATMAGVSVYGLALADSPNWPLAAARVLLLTVILLLAARLAMKRSPDLGRGQEASDSSRTALTG